jgi:uracil permease
MGGVSIALSGVIAAAGTRRFVEGKGDFGEKRNLILASVIMVLGVGGPKLHTGSVELDGMTLATAAGILLNLVLPRPARSPADESAQGAQPTTAAV